MVRMFHRRVLIIRSTRFLIGSVLYGMGTGFQTNNKKHSCPGARASGLFRAFSENNQQNV